MKHSADKTLPLLLTAFFAVAMVLFWIFPHISLLLYHEQYQLFLFTTDYLVERLSLPGGLADYLAEFCVQFNYVYVVGAILLTLWFVALQWLTWKLCQQQGAALRWYPLSFIPALLVWWYMSDVNVMPSFLVALVCALALMWLYGHYAPRLGVKARVALLVVSLVASYWLLGPVMYMLALYTVVVEGRLSQGRRLGLMALLAGVSVSVVMGLSAFWLPYPVHRLFAGLNYFRYPEYDPTVQYALMLVAWLLPLLAGVLPAWKARWAATLSMLGVLLLGGVLIPMGYRSVALDLIEYDYLVRTRQWDALLAKGERERNPSPMSVSCVNFALAQKGQLCDRLFEFYQNGGEGLIPSFTRDPLSPVSTGEIFFTLGMVNDARRHMFEAQEAIPNFRLSGRLLQRIAQCDIANGQYAVARKYLRLLTHSFAYASWAKEQLALLGDERAINAHPLYGKLRRYQVTEDFLFSEQEMDQMLGLLFTHCHDNRNAYEYLMAYELTQRDMGRFLTYYPIGMYAGYTDHIPYALQQALVYHWTQTHDSFRGMPWSIDASIVQAMGQFIQLYTRDPRDPSLSSPPLGNTFWSYMLVNKTKAQPTKAESREIY